MARRSIRIAIAAALMLLVSGCESAGSEPPSYQENKKMVLDMLKTDDGKETLQEILSEKELRASIVLDEPAVRQTIVRTLTTEQGKKLWKELLDDPDFSDKLARTMEKENEKLLMRLMKDPGYQQMMMDILKAPNLQEQYLSLLKTKSFREQIARSINEAITGPVFKKELADTVAELLKKQAESSGNGS